MMCTTLHALNAGLRDYRRRHCIDPVGAEVLQARPFAVQMADALAGSLPKRRRVSSESKEFWARLNATRTHDERRKGERDEPIGSRLENASYH